MQVLSKRKCGGFWTRFIGGCFFRGGDWGWNYILEDIPRFLITAWRRTEVLADVFTFGFLETNGPSGLTGRHGKGDCFTLDSKIFLWFHLPLFVLGASTVWRHRPLFHILPATLGICTVTVNAFFFGMTRYGIYLLPFILIYTSTGMVWLLKKVWKSGRWNMPKFHSENKVSVVLSGLLIALGAAQYFLGVEVRPARDFFLDGVVSLRQNHPKKTIAEWESAFQKIKREDNVIRDDLMLGRFSFKLSELYHRSGKAKKALRELDRTLNLDPFHVNALLNRGILSLRFGDAVQAKADFLHLVKWYPNLPEATQAFKYIGESVSSGVVKTKKLELVWGGAL